MGLVKDRDVLDVTSMAPETQEDDDNELEIL